MIQDSNQLTFFVSNDGQIKIQTVITDGSTWLTQKQMAELFGVDRSVITKHLQNIFETEELDEKAVCAIIAHTAEDGKTYQTNHYNLDAIISVGYRVDSVKATQFRVWATKSLKALLTDGFVISNNIEASKSNKEKLIEEVRKLRTSEKSSYETLKDCFKICSVDYDPNSDTAREFYSNMQNKFTFAITGQTSAEIIVSRVDANKDNMGLQTWSNDNIRKSDVTVAKNYLYEAEMGALNNVVLAFLEMSINFANRNKDLKMRDWVAKLDSMIKQFDYELLTNGGSISADRAKSLAHKEYDTYKENLKKIKA